MSANQRSRRDFLRTVAAGTFLTCVIPDSLNAFGNETIDQGNKKEKGMVILFQGDSITDGNRGRNYNDLNHIMSHGNDFPLGLS